MSPYYASLNKGKKPFSSQKVRKAKSLSAKALIILALQEQRLRGTEFKNKVILYNDKNSVSQCLCGKKCISLSVSVMTHGVIATPPTPRLRRAKAAIAPEGIFKNIHSRCCFALHPQTINTSTFQKRPPVRGGCFSHR
jgi:hypothetical protein